MELVSSAKERNTLVVKQLLEATTALPPPQLQRPVVIVFGQDHEEKILDELMSQGAATDKIHWWSFKSVDDQLTALTPRTDTMPGTFVLLGYVPDDPNSHIEVEMRLLNKGYVPQQFNAKVYNGDNLPKCRMATAVYSCDAVVQQRRASRGAASRGGPFFCGGSFLRPPSSVDNFPRLSLYNPLRSADRPSPRVSSRPA